MTTKQTEALRLADAIKASGQFTPLQNLDAAAAELRLLHAENETLRAGYDAARLEIASLQGRVNECGAGAGCCAQAARIAELEAQLEAVGAVGAVPDGWRLVPAQPTNKQVVMLAGALLHQKQNTADSRHPDWSNAVGQAEHAYRAMLEAAPEPQSAAQVQAMLAAPAQPVAWAIFAENGHCRMWTQNKDHADIAAKATGLPLTALYATPQPVAQAQAALEIAEAALADIGDADREPGDDVAWCEARAAKALPMVRAAITAQQGDKT